VITLTTYDSIPMECNIYWSIRSNTSAIYWWYPLQISIYLGSSIPAIMSQKHTSLGIGLYLYMYKMVVHIIVT
jgi:hypothetical protein